MEYSISVSNRGPVFYLGILLVLAVLFPGYGIAQGSAGRQPDKTAGIGLKQYSAEKKVRLKHIPANASGMTYCPRSETLFIVLDAPALIFEYSCTGEYIRQIMLWGVKDPEGIAYVGGDTFAVVDEENGILYEFSINKKTRRVRAGKGKNIKILKGTSNRGLEGLTFDPKTRRYYTVKEHSPIGIYAVGRRSGGVFRACSPAKLMVNDLSGVFFHRPSGHLLFLSHESSVVVEADAGGNVLGRMQVGLSKAEGVSMDDYGTIYVCGEPNEFQVYEYPELKREKARIRAACAFLLKKAVRKRIKTVSSEHNRHIACIKSIIKQNKYRIPFEDFYGLNKKKGIYYRKKDIFMMDDPGTPVAVLSVRKNRDLTYTVGWNLGSEKGCSMEILLEWKAGEWAVSEKKK